MKRLYVSAFVMLVFKNSFCSYSYNNSHSYGNNSSHDSSSSYQQVKQEPKQEEKSSYKESFEYAQQQFSTYDTRSHQLVSDTLDTLKTTKDPHEYGFNLGLYMALATTREAERTPQLAPSIHKASFSDPCLEQQQREAIKIHCSQVSSDQNVEKTATVAQKVSNFFVSLIQGFKEQAQQDKKRIDELVLATHSTNHYSLSQIPGLKHIKEFVSKFSQLSSEGKKTVGSLVLAGNMSDALKVISVGDKGVVYYRNTRENNVEGANPSCKVSTYSTLDTRHYSFDCPTRSNSVLHWKNWNCAIDIKNDTMKCPLPEKPFEKKESVDFLGLINLKFDHFSGAGLLKNQEFTESFEQELVHANEYLESFKEIKNTFSVAGLTHLYAQALLMGQDIFGVEPIPLECVNAIATRYQVPFLSSLKNNQFTQEDVKYELQAAREYVNSHALFAGDVPQNFNKNAFQYAEALCMMEVLVGFTKASKKQAEHYITQRSVIMPEKTVLDKKFDDLNLEYFAEKTHITGNLANNEFCFTGVVTAVDRAIADYKEYAYNSNNPAIGLDAKMMEKRRSEIVESLLSDYSHAVEALKLAGCLN